MLLSLTDVGYKEIYTLLSNYEKEVFNQVEFFYLLLSVNNLMTLTCSKNYYKLTGCELSLQKSYYYAVSYLQS